MDSVSNNYYFHSIRMSWLRWLSQPIILAWSFSIKSFLYVWSIFTMIWNGMVDSLNGRYLVIGVFGSSIGMLGYELIQLISEYLYRFNIIDGKGRFFQMGVLFFILSFIWSVSEISSLIAKKEKENTDIGYNSIISQFGAGIASIRFFLSYIFVIVIMYFFQYLITLSGLLPFIGPFFRGLISLPVFISSVIMILSMVIILFIFPLIGPYILNNDMSKSFINQSKSALIFIKGKWLDVIISLVPAIIICSLPALIAYGLTDRANSLSDIIRKDAIRSWFSPTDEIKTLNEEVNNLWLEVYQGDIDKEAELNTKKDLLDNAKQNLKDKRTAYDDAFSNDRINIFGYFGEILFVVTNSLVAGFFIGFFISSFANIFYNLYKRVDDVWIFHKLFGLFIWVVFFSFCFSVTKPYIDRFVQFIMFL